MYLDLHALLCEIKLIFNWFYVAGFLVIWNVSELSNTIHLRNIIDYKVQDTL